jgi:WhiB family redox-sensing transcriptional regulator
VFLRLEPRRARLLFDAGGWRRRAACRETGPELFFPAGERDEAAVAQMAAAKQVCARCDVRLHCLTYALVANPEDGVWGGLGPSERRALQRARRVRREARTERTEKEEAAAAPIPDHAERSAAL